MSFRLSRSTALLLLVLLLAAFLRFWQLGDLLPGLYHDEAYNGLDALSLLQGKTFPQFYEGWELYAQDAYGDNPPTPTRFPIFFAGNYGREPLHIYLMALAIWLFGPTPFAIRFIPALAGVLSVFTTYLAAKEVVNGQWSIANGQRATPQSEIRNPKSLIPLFAAFFMAILFSAVHFSHFGLRMTLFVPAETLAVYFFWRGVNRGEEMGRQGDKETRRGGERQSSTFSFLAAGFFLGLGLYIYAAGRLLPLVFVVFVPLWFWQDRAALRRHWRHVAVMAGVSLVTVLPLLLYFARYPYFFVFRMAYVANKGVGAVEGRPYLTWLNNVWRVVGGLFWQGETHLRHNLPGRPYLDPIQSILFVIGLVVNGRAWRNPRAQFLFLWLLVMLLPTLLSGDAPHFGRMSGAAPVIAILIAIGLAQLSQLLHSQFTIHNSQFILLSLLAASLFFTTRDYFFRYATHPQLAADFYLPDWELGQYAAAQPADAALYFTPTQEEMATIYFALADPERLRSYAGGQGLVPLGEEGQTAVYLLRPTATQSLADLQAVFPTGHVAETRPDFIAFHVPPAAPRLLTDQTTPISFADAIILRGWQIEPTDETLAVTLVWQAQTPISQDYTAFVHLLNETGELIAQLDRPPAGYPTSTWRVGELVRDTYRVPLPPDLPPGQYTVQTGFYSWPELVRVGETAVILGQFDR
jgi:4-amino-4-deoxy-L-arabinose transferase-like glycosyltransferase